MGQAGFVAKDFHLALIYNNTNYTFYMCQSFFLLPERMGQTSLSPCWDSLLHPVWPQLWNQWGRCFPLNVADVVQYFSLLSSPLPLTDTVPAPSDHLLSVILLFPEKERASCAELRSVRTL